MHPPEGASDIFLEKKKPTESDREINENNYSWEIEFQEAAALP